MTLIARKVDELEKRVTQLEESLRYLLLEAEEEAERDEFEQAHRQFAAKVKEKRERS